MIEESTDYYCENTDYTPAMGYYAVPGPPSTGMCLIAPKSVPTRQMEGFVILRVPLGLIPVQGCYDATVVEEYQNGEVCEAHISGELEGVALDAAIAAIAKAEGRE